MLNIIFPLKLLQEESNKNKAEEIKNSIASVVNNPNDFSMNIILSLNKIHDNSHVFDIKKFGDFLDRNQYFF